MRAEKITLSNEILGALNSGRLAYAIEKVSQAIERWPKDADFQLLAGMVAKQAGDLQNAQVFFEKAIVLRPDFASAYHNQGIVRALLGLHESAKEAFSRSIELDADNADSHLGLIQSLQALSEPDQAEALLREAIKTIPDDVRFIILLAELMRQNNQLTETLNLLEESESNFSGNASIQNQLGITLRQLGKIQQAIVRYRHAISLANDHAPAWNNLGLALLEAKQTESAIAAFESAVQLTPGWLEAQCNLAVAFNEHGDKQKAVLAARSAISLDEKSALAHFNLAAIQSQNFTVDDLNEAESAASTAIQLKPKYAEAHNCRALVLFKLGQLAEAESAAMQAVNIFPDNPVFSVTLSEIFTAQDKYTEAEQALMSSLEANNEHGETHRQLGILRLKKGLADTALPEIERALELDSTDQRGIAHQAIALQMLTRREEARQILGFDELIRENRIPCPEGYDSVKSFNQTLALEIENHPTLQFEPVGLAARGGSLAQDILHPRGPATGIFENFLRERITHMQNSLTENPAHPFLKHIPQDFSLNLWATLLISEGEIATHIHEGSWLSGAYYVKLPPEMEKDIQSNAGYIEFGRPNYDYQYEFETKLFKPEEGLLLLFPSYIYHRTIPFQSESSRISISFDLVPNQAIADSS